MRSMPHWPIPYVTLPKEFTIERMRCALNGLGDPHLALPPIIHVTGTNGKGSVIAYLQTMFESAGCKVHRYTSPHLLRYNERIYIAGKEINDNFLYSILEQTRIATEGLELTFFEATTVAAFLAFSKVNADILLMEVGMGGLYDATNVVGPPELCIIMPISYDHTEYLGTSLAQIAAHKAGIIKSGTKCVISWQYGEAMSVLQAACIERGVPYFACNEHWTFTATNNGFLFYDEDGTIELPSPSLHGVHQIMNAATYIAAARCIERPIKYKDIVNGLSNAKWPARLERMNMHAVPNNWEVWCDGAHNIEGAKMLAVNASIWKERGRKIIIINGRTANRDIKGFLEPFLGIATLVVGVYIQNEPKSEKAVNIYNEAIKLGFTSVACDSVADAISYIKDRFNQEENITIIITGSLYLYGDI